jgi:hypothetical protein
MLATQYGPTQECRENVERTLIYHQQAQFFEKYIDEEAFILPPPTHTLTQEC